MDKIGSLLKTTLVDYPGLVASTMFFYHCNFRCPYCYNYRLISDKPSDTDITISDLYEHLNKRSGVIKGLVLTGGEALLYPDLEDIIDYAKNLGYKIKLDTNGSNPDKLYKLINKLNYIALDIKSDKNGYINLTNDKDVWKNILYSIEIIRNDSKDHEFRTVLVPGLINKDTIINISSILYPSDKWYLARYNSKDTLVSNYSYEYDEYEYLNLESLAKSRVNNARLR
jgi:pyruvate formate lyase activating enzyme